MSTDRAPWTLIDRDDLTPVCPHCEHVLETVFRRGTGFPLGQGRKRRSEPEREGEIIARYGQHAALHVLRSRAAANALLDRLGGTTPIVDD